MTVPDFVLGVLFLSVSALALAGGWLLCEHALRMGDARTPPYVIRKTDGARVPASPGRKCPCCPCPGCDCEPEGDPE